MFVCVRAFVCSCDCVWCVCVYVLVCWCVRVVVWLFACCDLLVDLSSEMCVCEFVRLFG